MQALRGWAIEAHDQQLPPDTARDGSPDWTVWLFLGGRGAGKTRAGAEWVRGLATGRPPFASAAVSPIALIGETAADVREVMIEGVSGLLSVHPHAERPRWEPSRRRLVWPSGAVAQAFSAEEPDSLRGPQFAAAWCDEIGKWRLAQQTWDMLQFALRLGERPRVLVTTTPKPVPLVKALLADQRVALTRAKTVVNAFNLSPAFLTSVVAAYAGTRLGRQEIDGELIEERADALFDRRAIEAARIAAERTPPLARIVVAVDPPASSSKRADQCGIIVAGADAQSSFYVLEDASLSGAKPDQWAARVVRAYHEHQADLVIAEVNQGGEMVAAVIAEVDAAVPVKPLRANRGKALRAEPVAALYAQGRVRHAGLFPALEDEMCDFGPREEGGFGLSSRRSPDRLDALVWALTELSAGAGRKPRVRAL
jgi:phage terminase large subunit-like protein